MADLNYKTRGMSSPKGKPRVYFCCHPGDFERYFDPISDEILEKQNCSVWHCPEPDGDFDEQFFADLKTMQLFVMPVTTKLLCSANRALDVEFPFAVENHIPVLPLMQESGLEELFNKKCGDLQFLDKNNTDSTAISYDEKLDHYLSSVLIGDELAEKIRAAFDAYVFLSYRKKDRKYAQELMRLIHKNDFCRDIAIWYDEFLTPGENFNDSIRDALKKSGLFVLTVTPNLVNEINYIMTTEYPMAQREGKLILSAELVPTDKALLAEKYRDIPNCTDARQEAQLSDALWQAIQKLAIEENDDSPEHNFFIGLAYLGGVDVEVDHERAVALISSAAEDGVIEAIDKLVEMYRTGLGVERSYEMAVQWQEKKILRMEERYEREPDEEKLNDLFWSICACGDQYEALGKLHMAKQKYDQGLRWVETSGNASLQIRRDISAGYGRMGNICRGEGNLPGARVWYEKDLAISVALAEETGTVKSRRDLFISYNKLGDICREEGNLTGAKTWYEKAYAISAALAEELGTVESRRDLSFSYNKLGSICWEEGDLSGAKAWYEKDFTVSAVLAAETGTAESRCDLSVSYDMLGNVCLEEGDLSGAKTWYEKSLAISVALAEELGTVKSRRDLSAGYNMLGNICLKEGDLPGAKAWYEKGLAINEALAEEAGTVKSRRDLSVSYNKLGNVCWEAGDLTGAKAWYEKVFAISAALAEETGTAASRRDLSVSYNKLGNVCWEAGDLTGAKSWYEKDLVISAAVAEETGTVGSRRDLSVSYNKLGNVCRKVGDLTGAKAWYEKALAIIAALAEETGMVEFRRDLSVCYDKLGDICREEGDLSGAKTWYEEGLAISAALAKETGTVESRRDLSVCYDKLGDICRGKGDLSGAKVWYEKSFVISEALAKEIKTADGWDDLAISCYKLALISPEKKAELLRQSALIYQTLCKHCPGVAQYRDKLEIIESMLNQQ